MVFVWRCATLTASSSELPDDREGLTTYKTIVRALLVRDELELQVMPRSLYIKLCHGR